MARRICPYYIGKKNVMPTRKFYEYIMHRLKKPFPGMTWRQPDLPVYPQSPPNKVYNPHTRRFVTKTGKIGKILLQEQSEMSQMHPIWPAYVLRYGINYEERKKKFK
jgi:hypothetical protein